MALIINKQGLKNANGGQDLPETGVFCRFIPIPEWKGAGMRIEYKFYPDSAAELKYSEMKIILEEDKEVPTIDGEGTEIVKVKTAPQNPIRVNLADGFALAHDEAVNQLFDTVKDTPLGQGISSFLGTNGLRAQCMFHVVAKVKLEEFFGENTVDIRLDLI
jgi:hypothetical protein